MVDTVEQLTSQMGAMGLEEQPRDNYTHLIVPPKSLKFDDDHAELRAAFEGKDLSKFDGLTLSGNSYGTPACTWIAQNILQGWTNLKYVNFSNIFISRLKEDLPVSLKIMMEAIMGKQIEHLDLSHNAFGPQGVASF